MEIIIRKKNENNGIDLKKYFKKWHADFCMCTMSDRLYSPRWEIEDDVYIIYDNNKPIGAFFLGNYTIYNAYLCKEYRGKGIIKKILDFVSKKHGCALISTDIPAIANCYAKYCKIINIEKKVIVFSYDK